jgi:hypothetical protein
MAAPDLLVGQAPQLSEPELRDAPRIDKPVNRRSLTRAVKNALDAAPD